MHYDLTYAQNHQIYVSVKIKLSNPSELSDILPYCTNVRSLDLSDNRIGAEGAKAIAQTLLNLPNLQSLDLSRNWIEADGEKALEALKVAKPHLIF